MVGGGVNSNVGRLMGSCGVAKATVQCDAASRHEVTTVLDALVGDDGGTSRGGNAMVFGTVWGGGDGGDGGVEEELNVVLGGFFGGAGQGGGAGVKKHRRQIKILSSSLSGITLVS
jgi:hypothetical protein